MGVPSPVLLRLAVHHTAEVLRCASCQPAQSLRRIVGGPYHHCVNEIPDIESFPLLKVHHRALFLRLVIDCNLFIQIQRIQNHQAVQNLRDAGGISLLMGIFLIYDRFRLCLHQNGAGSIQLRQLILPFCRCKRRHCPGKGQCRNC